MTAVPAGPPDDTTPAAAIDSRALRQRILDRAENSLYSQWIRAAYDLGYTDGEEAGAARAAAAERERIRQLAIEHDAECYVACPDPAHCRRGVPHNRPFADLLDPDTTEETR